MKRITALLIIIVMVFTLGACSSDSESSSNSENNANSQKYGATAEVDSEGRLVLTKDTRDVYLVNTDEFSLFVEKLDVCKDEHEPVIFCVTEENKSEDMQYRFEIINVAVDGINASSQLLEELSPGEMETEDVKLYSPNIPDSVDYDCRNTTVVTFEIRVEDEDFDTVLDGIEVVVYTKDENSVKLYERETQPTDKLIFDKSDVKVSYIGVEDVDDGETELIRFYVENHMDIAANVRLDDLTINGKAVEANMWDRLIANSKAYDSIDLYTDDLATLGVKSCDELETLEGTLIIRDDDENIIAEENIELNFWRAE